MSTQPTDKIAVLPEDEHNQHLVSNVHPPRWINPDPASSYNLVVIGAGTAGLISAIGSASLGAKVALIEKHLMGGDCLNVGCVPSKGLIRAARAYADVRDAGDFGTRVPAGAQADFPAVMARMRRLRSQISNNDSAKRYTERGVDVFLGVARFSGPDTIEVDGKTLKFSKAVIATGARASIPRVPGLVEAGYLTNETIFSLTELPPRMAVIGAGPIGCEMAQSFSRFGSKVSLIEKTGHILPREDADAANLVQESFLKDGVSLLFNSDITGVEKRGQEKVIHLKTGGKKVDLVVDHILVGVGRSPNVEGLNLEAVGVEYDTRAGVHVNDHLRTTNPKIFSAGDICFPYKFTHTAEAMAGIVIQNALFMGRKKASEMIIPWCTYTDPELAHVGLSEKDAGAKGIPIDTFVHPFKEVDRALLDGEADGFVKVLAKKGTGKILGATIVTRHAGEMVSEITLAMNGQIGLGTLASTIHPYPTQAEGMKRVGGAYMKTRLTPLVKSLFKKWLQWTR